MFAILINEKGGEQKRLDFDKPEVTIGRVQGNDIILPKGNVSKRHSRIVLKDGKFIIVDLKSTNGTYVNGRKITSPLVVKSTDKIYIGDFILSIEEGAGGSASAGAGADDPAASSAATPQPAGRPAPPPPPRPTRNPPPTTPAAAVKEDAAPDVSAGAEDSGESQAEAALPPRAQGRPPVPSLPPRPITSPRAELPPRSGGEPTRPVTGGPTAANELVREPAPSPRPAPPERPDRPDAPAPRPGPIGREPSPLVSSAAAPTSLAAPMAAMDRPVVADRISEKATMAATESPLKASAAQATLAPGGLAGTSLPPMSPRPTLSRGVPATLAPMRSPATRPANRPTGAISQLQVDDPRRRRHVDLLNQVVGKAIEQLGLQTLTAEQYADSGLAPRVENAVGDIVDKLSPLPIGFEIEPITKEAVAEVIGAGPLDDLLGDDTVHEVAVTSHDRIYVDRGTGQTLSDKVYSSPAGVLRAIHRLVVRAGAKLEGTLTEVRLETGALLQVALPPHARVPSLIVRRARKTGGRLQDLVDQGVMSAAMSEFLELCMRERRNFIVSGYGRGVMMGALGGATAAGARVVTVEPVSELDLSGSSAAWIGLVGRGGDTRNVLSLAVRLHPDHLMITDVRGPEALDVAAALCGGQGVVVGVDAASARDGIARIESLSRLSAESPPRKALREELAQGLHLAVHVGRTTGGAYRVMEISEVTLAEEGGLEVIAIFSFKPEGADGQFMSTGHVPAFAG